MLDGKHYFTSIDSYDDIKSYTYKFVDEAIEEKVVPYVIKAFNVLKYRDYAKFDIRLDENDNTPYFIDCNPNTAFGPDMGLPMTEVADLFGVSFVDMIQSLLTKHIKAKQ
jgi:D-alanine-D-alanine ligase-like ATP-grasp enzyme